MSLSLNDCTMACLFLVLFADRDPEDFIDRRQAVQYVSDAVLPQSLHTFLARELADRMFLRILEDQVLYRRGQRHDLYESYPALITRVKTCLATPAFVKNISKPQAIE